MGAEIAQLACRAGSRTLLWDPDAAALAAGAKRLRESLARGAERGRWSEADAEEAAERLSTVNALERLAPCGLVIEAAPEKLELKRELFRRLEEVCGPDAILATNTSSLSVTAIAAGAERPQRIVGMHFFNPPARMELVEIVPGARTSEEAVRSATELAERMGRTPIRAADRIGFVANRCARPFFLESLRILGDGIAGHEEIDRIARLGGGFRMGPFELIDLIGVDVNLSVSRSFYEQSHGEPRWRPSAIQEQMVTARRLGRKTGGGFYEYEEGRPYRTEDAEVEAERPILDQELLRAVAGPKASKVLARVGAQIVNEAAFALGEGVAAAEDIDTAMRLGYNWPLGPLEWGERVGYARVIDELEALQATHGEAYRPAPELRRLAA